MIQSFLTHLYQEGKAKSTLDEYRRRLEKYNTYLITFGLDIYQVKTKELILIREAMLVDGLSVRRINQVFSTVRVYYDYLILHEQLDFNPVVLTLHMTPKVNRIEQLSKENMENFRSYVDSCQINVRCAFLLMLATGARVGEIAALTKSDFFYRDKQLYISITDAKWGSDREIPVVDPDIVTIIETFLEDIDITSLPVFRISKRTLQRHMTNFSQTTGIPCHCHLLRHTFAAKLLEEGVPLEAIKVFLGHKNINMTVYYTQSARVDLTQVQGPIWQIRT